MRVVLLILCFLLLSAPARAFDGDLSGVYDCQGFNAAGEPYVGQVEIRQNGDIYLVSWRIGAADAYEGVGIVTGNVLSVSYYGGIEGIVVYDISDGARLYGRWAVRNGDGRVFVENLVRRDYSGGGARGAGGGGGGFVGSGPSPSR